MYLNYYENEVNDIEDNKPIGIIFCTDKSDVCVEYALNGIDNNIFTSKYTMYISKKEELQEQVNKMVSHMNNRK